MNREQALNYMRSSGWSEEQINTVTEALTCEDAISRQAVKQEFAEWHKGGYQDSAFYKYLDKMPSVSVAEKTGRWITQWNPAHQKEYYYCSECREEYSYDGETGIKINNYKFCPNCGCRMMEVEE